MTGYRCPSVAWGDGYAKAPVAQAELRGSASTTVSSAAPEPRLPGHRSRRTCRGGFFCEAVGFYVDPWQPDERAVVTHAHADHARAGGRRYLGSFEGERVLRRRVGTRTSIESVEFGEILSFDGPSAGTSSHVRVR